MAAMGEARSLRRAVSPVKSRSLTRKKYHFEHYLGYHLQILIHIA
jgi:hypothetical protein